MRDMLRPRLRALAAHVLPGHPAADVCCDHAQLASELVEQRIVPSAIGVDLHLSEYALKRVPVGVVLREGDGLSVLDPGEVATVVVAGVGARAVGRILSAGRERLAKVRRLVLQPSGWGYPALGQLRQRLAELGWVLVDESLVRDRGRLYVVLVAEPGRPIPMTAADCELGPILRRGADPHWPEWLELERVRADRICGVRQGPTLALLYLSLLADALAPCRLSGEPPGAPFHS